MSWARACFAVGGELALDETGWGGAFAGGFALVLVALLGAFVAVAGPLATVVQLRPRRRRVVTAVLGRPAQLVARGLNSVGGGGTSRASGGGATRRPVGGKLWERREPAWALSHVATVGVAGPGSDSAKSSKAPRAASSPSAVRVRLGAAAALLVVPCRERTAWRSGSGGTRAGPWTMDWGQVATGRFGKAGEPVAFPRALRSQAGGAPSTIRRAPPRPCWTVRRTRGARQGGPLIGLDPDAPRAQQPVHGCSDGDAATAGGAPWWSARGHGRGSRPG